MLKLYSSLIMYLRFHSDKFSNHLLQTKYNYETRIGIRTHARKHTQIETQMHTLTKLK